MTHLLLLNYISMFEIQTMIVLIEFTDFPFYTILTELEIAEIAIADC